MSGDETAKRAGRLHPIRHYGKAYWQRRDDAIAALSPDDAVEYQRLQRNLEDAQRQLSRFEKRHGIKGGSDVSPR